MSEMIFPAMYYHPELGAVVVSDDAELASLGPMWAATPFTDTIAIAPQVVSLADLQKIAAPVMLADPPEAIVGYQRRGPGRPRKVSEA